MNCRGQHHWVATASPEWQVCQQCSRVRRLVKGRWVMKPNGFAQEPVDWWQSEYDMLNASYPPSYVDERKASDLKNYWR